MKIRTVKDGEELNLEMPFPMEFFDEGTVQIVMTGSFRMGYSREQMSRIIEMIREYRKSHDGWKIIEVCSADGVVAEITV